MWQMRNTEGESTTRGDIQGVVESRMCAARCLVLCQPDVGDRDVDGGAAGGGSGLGLRRVQTGQISCMPPRVHLPLGPSVYLD